MAKKNRPSHKQHSKPLNIIGIGASAGGLTALKTFFSHVPENSGFAFIIVVHRSPEHKSHLVDLLQPHVNMPMVQVTETMPLEANQIYVIPPGCNLNTIDTHLRLSGLEEQRSDRTPIDHFFYTLANTYDGQAIGVILSGTGSDGTSGIKEIKERGGLTIVQNPQEAEYRGMPQSAISTGHIDLVLPVSKIPENILNFTRTEPHISLAKENEDLQEDERQLLQKIFAQLRARTGRDFSRYKRSTIMRRLQRRLQLAQIVELKDYLALLREKPIEVQILSDDLLITVTSFFRDPEVFDQLKQKVIPRLFEGKGPEDSVRIWSVGCATGEEVYSLAILLLEEASQYESPPNIQIFASDLHEHSLKKAREGYYPGNIETDISSQRLQKFFTKEDSGFRIRQEVRELIVFTPHNLLSDPPFSKLDLIACRNLLIYLQREVQRDVIGLFHYILNAGGFLLLGTSETIESSELFTIEDKGHGIFRKRNVPPPELRLPVFPLTGQRTLGKSIREGNDHESSPVDYGMLHHWMVEQYAPPSLLVSPDHKVAHISERAGRYLVYPGGKPTTNVFNILRKEFRIELQAALEASREKGMGIRSKPILVRIEGVPRLVALYVHQAKEPQQEGFSLVIFEEWEVSEPSGEGGKVADTSDVTPKDATIRELKAELHLTKQRLQAIIEKQVTGQEEMRASNEEMQSTNEELRSTLEELETSKEELQSMNEELTAVNQENRKKVEELAQLSSDLQNFLKATDIATLFLDRQLRIMRFTPKICDIFNVQNLDRGRLLSDLTHQLGYDELQRDAWKVLDKLIPVEHEVKDQAGRWYLTRILPYRSTNNRIEGVVITFVDTTERRRIEQVMRESEEHLRLIMNSATDYVIFTMDMERKITDWNAGAERILGYSKEEIIGKDCDIIYTDEDKESGELKRVMKMATEQGRTEHNRWYVHKNGSRFWGSGTMMPLRGKDNELRGFLKIMTDDTERMQMEEALKKAKEEAEQAAKAKEDFLAHMSHEIRTPLNAIVGLSTLLLQQNPQPSQIENLNTLKFSAENLRVLVNDILDFSKIQAGKVVVEENNVNLRELLYSLQKAHELRAHEQGNVLQFYIDEQLPEVVGTDQLKLSQVLHNLVSNAVKFTQQGVVKVEVTLQRKKGKQLWVDFSVRDTGIGIPADKLSQIFDAFTQTDNSAGRPYEGTGLGLSITKLLLELMGSQIAVESKVGEGSHFYFTLPMKEGKAETSPEVATPPSQQAQEDLQNLRLLLVEDMDINRDIIIQFLQQWWQLMPDEAADGKQAIDMAQKKQYDLILMDIRMPVMDGYQAAKAIRALPDKNYEQVPIIALTADTMSELKKYSEASLFTDVLTKPFDAQDLQKKIIRWAEARHESKVKEKRTAGKTVSKQKRSQGKVSKSKRAGKKVTGKSATPVMDGPDTQKLETLFKNDPQRIKQFLNVALEKFTDFQQQFATAMANRDEALLSNLKHKMHMLMDMLTLQELEAILEQCQLFLQENAPQDQINEAKQKMEAAVAEVLASVKKYIDDIK